MSRLNEIQEALNDTPHITSVTTEAEVAAGERLLVTLDITGVYLHVLFRDTESTKACVGRIAKWVESTVADLKS